MSLQTLCATHREQARSASIYRRLSLVDLAGRIAGDSDRLAMREFHEGRTVFRNGGGGPLLFAEFVDSLRHAHFAGKLTGRRAVAMDRAYDLTIDKFTALPDVDSGDRPSNRRGPDCRRYFRGFLDRMERWLASDQTAGPLDVELMAAKVLQRCVAHHFCLSCLEARRRENRAMSRYAWRVDDQVIRVRMPAAMPGRQRGAWLARHVDDPDPSRPDEQARVQAIINADLGQFEETSLGDNQDQIPTHRPEDLPLTWLLQHEVTARGLADVVADEKARRLEEQRPAIRAVGGDAVRRLIQRIFDDLSAGCYHEAHLAHAFGLSKSTLSRFAGSRWRRRAGGAIPDLWTNTAHTLANHTAFVEAARDAGVWGSVEQVLGQSHREASYER